MISPEGCASILWKSQDKRETAAEAMGITADRLAKFGLVDELVREPLGGAHRDPQAMAERGVRYLKISAALLLGRVPHSGAQVHPADLVDLLGRYGIDLIAEKIETEATVVDLLDYDLGFGQGVLFAPPRPIRSDILKGEVAEFPAADAKPAEPMPAPRQNDISKLVARTVRRA